MTPGPGRTDRSSTVRIDGTELALGRSGSGPPVFLIHGLGGPAMWERVAPILAETYEVFLPHIPGFGESPPSARPLTAGGHAAIFARLLDELDIAGVTVAGISYGGGIAALLAAARPGRVGSLALICPTGTRRYPFPLRSRAVRAALLPLLRRGLVKARVADALSRRSFHDPGVRPPDLVARHLERLRLPGRIDALLAAIDEIWSGDSGFARAVGRLPIPLTLVWGTEDRTVPFEYSEPLREARPDAELIAIPSSGHSVPLERPVELAEAIRRAAARSSRPS